MLFASAVANCKRARHGPRTQAKTIECISLKIKCAEIYAERDEDFELVLQPILRDCHENVTPDVHVDALRRWWNTYEEWGELP